MLIFYKFKKEQIYNILLLVFYVVGCIFFHTNPIEILLLGLSIYYLFKTNKKRIYILIYYFIMFIILMNLLSSIRVNDKLKNGDIKMYYEDFIITEEPEKRRKVHDQLEITPVNFSDNYYFISCGIFKKYHIHCPRHDYGKLISVKYTKVKGTLMYRLLNQQDRIIYYQIIYNNRVINRENYLQSWFHFYYKEQIYLTCYIFVYLFLFSFVLYQNKK